VSISTSSAAAFACKDPESIKKTDNFTVFFALSGSVRIKAAHRTSIKLTPGVIVLPPAHSITGQNLPM